MSTRDTSWPYGHPAWIDLNSHDLRATRATYGHLFGWDLGDAVEGEYAIALKNGRSVAGVYAAEDGKSPAWLLYFGTDDVTATVERATEAGATVLVAASDAGPASGRFAILQDPAGAAFGLWQGGELTGMQMVGEPGGFGWASLLTRDLPTASEFYSTLFGYRYDEITPDLLTARNADGEAVATLHLADQLPDDVPPTWNIHLAVASRDATVSLAEMEDDLDVLATFDTSFGAEAVLRGPSGEVFNVMETLDTE
ncbi:VOC family protein [Demetria terragena]|uniref:VOC family protein n=1 Tax=Demetria terragena TaxID=63959 RepID=UPI0012EA87C3|nr:VOC family protein [Demetria terragena]